MALSPPSMSREKILLIARRMFVEHGFQAISMRAIADEAGSSKALIYHYFENKEKLFLAVAQISLDDLEGLIQASRMHGESCRSQVTYLVQSILYQPLDQTAGIRLALMENTSLSQETRSELALLYEKKFLAPLRSIFIFGSSRGELRSLHPGDALWIFLGLIWASIYSRRRNDIRNLSTRAELIVLALFEGISNPNWIDDSAA
jgi:AcrR family transcriptional regulator